MTAGRYETRYRRVHLPRIRWDDSLNLTRTVLSLSKLSSLRVIVGVPGYRYTYFGMQISEERPLDNTAMSDLKRVRHRPICCQSSRSALSVQFSGEFCCDRSLGAYYTAVRTAVQIKRT